MASARISLNNPVFAGRLRTISRRTVVYERRAVEPVRPRLLQDVRPAAKLQPVSFKKRVGTKTRILVKPQPRVTKSNVLRRTSVQAPTIKRRASKKVSSKRILMVLSVMLFLFGVGVGVDGLRANNEVVAQVQSIQQSAAETGGTGQEDGNVASAAIPAEDDAPDVDAHKVAADLPRALYIPKLDVKARVLHVGTTRDGAVAAPSNVLDTGWFKESAKPGQSGAMLIDGHVHGPTKPGIFANLKKLKAGDEITIERGDGKTYVYEVVQTKTYPADQVDMGAALTPITAGKSGVNLITCTGELDKATNHYKDRLVVFAAQK